MDSPLLNIDVQDFIESNYKEDISRIVLAGSPFPGVNTQELATQLVGKKKAEKKLPTWFKTHGIIYPPTQNLEQTSSEKTAGYKASLVQGDSLIDLTGGFGIDAYYFAKKVKKVVHCELNQELSEIAAHNADLLRANNIETYTGDSIHFLQETADLFDWIYADPSRRDESGGRVFLLSDCLPNIPKHLDLLFSRSTRVLLKTSPLLDITAGLSELKNVVQIHVIAIDNEVKELLWVLKKDSQVPTEIITTNFRRNEQDEVYSVTIEEMPQISFSTPLTYLYEPNAAIMKSGQVDRLGHDLNLFKLHPNSQLFTAKDLKPFPGRVFEVLQTLPYTRKKLKKFLPVQKANITTRNFPASVEEIRKQLKIADGGEYYLFFTTLESGQKVCIICKKR